MGFVGANGERNRSTAKRGALTFLIPMVTGLASHLAQLPVNDAILDGEFVCLDALPVSGNGKWTLPASRGTQQGTEDGGRD